LVVAYNWDNAWGYNPLPSGVLADTIGTLNPLRYRGYVYDTETGLYYLQTRYYDPEIGRFINADSFTSTGQGLTGNNMFAYCGNNPVNGSDPTGHMMVYRKDISGYGGYADLSGLFVQLVAGIIAELAPITAGVIGYGIHQATKAQSISDSKIEEKSEAIVIPKEPDNSVIFPADPNAFNPIGLVKVHRTGTKNGAIINWMDPLTNTEVFRWDENSKGSNGSHYHINGTGHYYPNDIVPEPYATIYFPHEQ